MNSTTTMSSSKTTTIRDAIIKDHRKLATYYNDVIQSSNDTDAQERYGNRFTRELARHLVAEDIILYPAFRKYLGADGKNMAWGDCKDHHEVRVRDQSFFPKYC